jgi:hypothetical protein
MTRDLFPWLGARPIKELKRQNCGNGSLQLIQAKPGWSVLWQKNMSDYILPFT